MTCTCPSCTADGQHDQWCTVHLADHEAMARPPCDCGQREGVRRTPALKPVTVIASVDPKERSN